MTDFRTLSLSLDGSCARLTIERPQQANGMSFELIDELEQVADVLTSMTTLKVLVITANGPFFCAGGDINDIQSLSGDIEAEMTHKVRQLNRFILTISQLDAVVICAVNGVASGAGFSLAISADLTLSAASAKFTTAYIKLGVSPDGNASYILPRLVGLRKAQELLLTSPILSAEEALKLGLINRVVADNELQSEADQLAEQLAQYSQLALASTKKLLAGSFDKTQSQQLEMEAKLIANCVAGDDAQEGIQAFLEKRAPKFA
ncbi:enoyl-CoA hydratase/isomerase family protein [Paraferrimonas haliotis]|uniref:Enoyl-CoA hydratase n=1 Tax=Paraferrimonas haliotis TaxID=2013866 RepID=A0AA37WYU9_9GAMM|nr:enoyl-CoA hydratase-related protein [Paraferrimonas haliotis]GLS84185.1 enoyl-CoA hydratase [Paraferrimonas haliotis]